MSLDPEPPDRGGGSGQVSSCQVKQLCARPLTRCWVLVGLMENWEEISTLSHWCKVNNLDLNVPKTKEMVVDLESQSQSGLEPAESRTGTS